MLARDQFERRPFAIGAQRALDDERQDAGANQRGFADAGIARDQDERLDAKPIDHAANGGIAAEEERAMLGLERGETAIRIAFGDGFRCLVRRELLERVAKLLGRLVTLGW